MSALTYIRVGVWGGLGSGLLATALELSKLCSYDMDWLVVLTLVGSIIPAFTVCGAGCGLLLGAVLKLGQTLAHGRLSGKNDLAIGLIVMGGASPFLFLFVRKLATGRQAAELLGSVWTKILLVSLAALFLGISTWGGLRLAKWLRQNTAWFPCLVIGLLLVATTIVIFLADAFLYRRLYGYIHQLLMLIYLGTGILATLCLGQLLLRVSKKPRFSEWTRRALTIVFLIALVGGGWLARSTLGRDQRIRFFALELTTVTARILSFAPLEVGAETPLFLDAETRYSSGNNSDNESLHRVHDANVVLVSIDALRPDHLGAYGYKRRTSPNIDALSRNAIRFEGAYCQAPLTCYSVPSIHTGDYLKSTLPLLSKPPPTLAQMLGARGYTTAGFYNASIFFCDDKRAMSYGNRRFGFKYTETKLRSSSQLTNQVLAYLQQFRRSGKKKLFLWVHYFDVHEPYRRRSRYDFGSRDIDRYDSEIAYTDAAIGRLVASLHQLEGPTILVLTSDHGEEFKEHGGNYHGSSLYEEQVRVPLIIGVPGLKPQVVKSPAQLVDIVPTILSLLGLPIPESVRGRSLVPELMGRGDPDRTAFSEVHTKKMVRFRHWKLIHDFRRSTFQLYDLLTDASERVNLIGRRPREGARLKAMLHKWFDRLRGRGKQESSRPEGIDLGRIGDRRAGPMLSRLLLDPSTNSKWRIEAARLIGEMQDHRATESLWEAVADDDSHVAAEAAIALGELKDQRARVILPRVLENTDDDLRMRAGIALARVDSPEATPVLLEAMYSHNWEIQNRAAHYLGFVGDRRAISPLLKLSQHLHLRSRIALALGRIGRRFKDRRIFHFLLRLVRKDKHSDVRQRALGGLGYLGDYRAVRHLHRFLAHEPDLTWTPETISRLGGVGGYWFPGVDFSPRRQGLKYGWGRCVRNRSSSSEHYLGSTWCAMSRVVATTQFVIRRRPFPAQLMIRLRPIHRRFRGAQMSLSVNGRKVGSFVLHRGWKALRIKTRRSIWRAGENEVRFHLSRPSNAPRSEEAGLVAVDYLILAAADGRGKKKKRVKR